jgi:hypothetical protein
LALPSSQWLQPKHFNQCLIPFSCTAASLDILSLALLSSQWLQPKHFNQCLIPFSFTALLAILSLAVLLKKIQPIPDSTSNFYSSIFSLDATKLQIQRAGDDFESSVKNKYFCHLVNVFEIETIH